MIKVLNTDKRVYMILAALSEEEILSLKKILR